MKLSLIEEAVVLAGLKLYATCEGKPRSMRELANSLFTRDWQQQDVVSVETLNTVSVGAEERRKEFHERLKREVAKLTCDVETDRTKFWAYMDDLSQDQLANLANVLRLELLQVIKAVEEAK